MPEATERGGRLAAAPRRWLISVLPVLIALASCGSPDPDLAWQRIQEQGRLRVGMDANWVPFGYLDGTGHLIGFDVELARELCRRIGLEVHFVANLSYDALYDALEADQVDVVISAVVVDMARSAGFAYSVPYFDAGQVLIVRRGEADIARMEDLDQHSLAVELGSDGDTIARRWARRLQELTVVHVDSAAATVAAVAIGEADAALTDHASALLALKELRQEAAQGAEPIPAGLEPEIRGELVSGEQYAAVVRRESTALLRALNAALAEMRDDGTLQQLEQKWLGP